MTILHITTHLNQGGIARYLLSVASGFRQKGHNVIVASSGGELCAQFSQQGIIHIEIPIRTKNEASVSALRSYLRLRNYLSEHPVDIVHAHTRVAQVIAHRLGKKFHIPVVTTCHGFFRPRWHRKLFPCWGDAVIAISSQVKQHLMSDFGVPENKIYLIHHGIDVSANRERTIQEKARLKEEIGILADTIVIGTAARFSDVKGLEYFIRAFPFVKERYPRIQFALVGFGREEERLRALVAGLAADKNIIFYRPSDDICNYLSVMDIFVMPSIQEGLGLSILEAQAQKIPVIASRVGGIPDIIQDRETGILVEPRDAQAIGGAIISLLQDAGLYQRIQNSAYQQVIDKFSLEHMIQETEKVYGSLQ